MPPDDDSTTTWSGVRRGVLRSGEWVRLTDTKGRRHNICLEDGRRFFTNRGSIDHDDLIGRPEGFSITSSAGGEYLVFRPLLSEFVVSMPRGAAVVYPKDAAQIVAMADIFPGARVLEAGVGSGALTCSLLRAVGTHGFVASYERRQDFADVAVRNVDQFFGGRHPAWRLTVGDLVESLEGTRGAEEAEGDTSPQSAGDISGGGGGEVGGGVSGDLGGVMSGDVGGDIDRAILDMLAPWECIEAVAAVLTPGGILCAYVATTTQLGRTVETLRAHGGFTEPQAWETLVRDWHVEGLAIRPGHKMSGHTGFLVTARRMAAGERAPSKKRRPAPGAYGTDYTGPRPPGLPPTAAEESADA